MQDTTLATLINDSKSLFDRISSHPELTDGVRNSFDNAHRHLLFFEESKIEDVCKVARDILKASRCKYAWMTRPSGERYEYSSDILVYACFEEHLESQDDNELSNKLCAAIHDHLVLFTISDEEMQDEYLSTFIRLL